MKYWDYIQENLPDYRANKDVLKVDILTRYLDDEEVDAADLMYVFGDKKPSYKAAIVKLYLLEQKLMSKAMIKEQAEFVKALKHGKDS